MTAFKLKFSLSRLCHYTIILKDVCLFQGVIFSVDYDPVSQRMCSVSDDRSIRLYQVSFPHTDNDGSLTDWENIETSLIHVLYGHSARVWDVKLMSKVFVSVGEVGDFLFLIFLCKVRKKESIMGL